MTLEDHVQKQAWDMLSNKEAVRQATIAIARGDPEAYLQMFPPLVDRLTGAQTRSYLTDVLLPLYEGQIAKGTINDLSFAVWDIDKFKNFNDTFGHLAGDQVLAYFASHLQNGFRTARRLSKQSTGDLVIRYGGEEFITVLPGLGNLHAYDVVDRVRSDLSDQTFIVLDKKGKEQDVKITASVGITAYKVGDDFESLFNRADGAMYRAKEAGRNQAHVIA
jgi:diguanylate cyclase (GGDEF)-like protein